MKVFLIQRRRNRNDEPKTVNFRVLREGNEKLPLLDQSQKLRVKGKIADVGLNMVFLDDNPQIELV
jgi:hypothetical protein